MGGKAKPKKKKFTPIEQFPDTSTTQDDYATLLSDLNEFIEFRTKILPAIRKDLATGMSAPELRKKYAALVQARIITEALTTPDAGKATALAKDVIDRVEGKATEKKEVTVKYADVSDEELDALLMSEEAELAEMMKQ